MAESRSEQVAAFYARHARTVKRVVERQVRDGPTADDACSMAWEKLLKRPDIDLDAGGAKWLCTVAMREGWRDARTTADLQRLDAPAIDDQTLHDHAARKSPDGPARTDASERLGLLDELHPDQRQAVLLQAAGLTYSEISAATGATRRKTHRDLHRGHASLRQLDRTGPPGRAPRDPVALLQAARRRHSSLVLERADSPAEAHADLNRRLRNTAAAARGLCAEVAEQQVASPPPWAQALFGQRPAEPRTAAAYDHGVREAARYRVTYNVGAGEARLGIIPMARAARAAFDHAAAAVQDAKRALGQPPMPVSDVGRGRAAAAAATGPRQLTLDALTSRDQGASR